MGKLILKKVRAASLVETIVSLVIILAVFAIATTILVQVTSAGTSFNRLKAKAILSEYAAGTHQQKAYFDEEVTGDEHILKREVTAYKDNNLLRQIRYYIYNSNHVLLDSWQEVVLAE